MPMHPPRRRLGELPDYIYIYIHTYIYECVYVCLCKGEREREREGTCTIIQQVHTRVILPSAYAGARQKNDEA